MKHDLNLMHHRVCRSYISKHARFHAIMTPNMVLPQHDLCLVMPHEPACEDGSQRNGQRQPPLRYEPQKNASYSPAECFSDPDVSAVKGRCHFIATSSTTMLGVELDFLTCVGLRFEPYRWHVGSISAVFRSLKSTSAKSLVLRYGDTEALQRLPRPGRGRA